MILLAFSLFVTLFMLKEAIKLFALIHLHRHEILTDRHSNEHLAATVLLIIANLGLLVGLAVLFLERYIFETMVSEALISFISGMFGLFGMGVIWYIQHLQKEELGEFKEDNSSHNSSP